MREIRLVQSQIDALERAKRDYKFLGWDNGTPSEAILKCVRELGHRPIHIQHNIRGSEMTEICDQCKIYWKYDCSD